MKRVLIALGVIVLAAGLVAAQEKASHKKPLEKTLKAQVVGINDAKSTILLKRGNDEWLVSFNESTKWTKPEGAKSVDAPRSEFKVGSHVICVATANEKGNLVASRIELRTSK